MDVGCSPTAHAKCMAACRWGCSVTSVKPTWCYVNSDSEQCSGYNTGKRRRGNPEALARLAKRAKPAAFDDEGPADEPQAGYQRVPWFHETALLRETSLRGRSASTLFSCRRMRKRSMGRQSKGRSSSLPRSWAASRISSHRSMPPRWLPPDPGLCSGRRRSRSRRPRASGRQGPRIMRCGAR